MLRKILKIILRFKSKNYSVKYRGRILAKRRRSLEENK